MWSLAEAIMLVEQDERSKRSRVRAIARKGVSATDKLGRAVASGAGALAGGYIGSKLGGVKYVSPSLAVTAGGVFGRNVGHFVHDAVAGGDEDTPRTSMGHAARKGLGYAAGGVGAKEAHKYSKRYKGLGKASGAVLGGYAGGKLGSRMYDRFKSTLRGDS